MSLIKKLFFLILCYSATLFGANVEVTTFYGKTGGIVGVLNTTEQVVNGRTICSENPTIGCDFGDDPGFSNNGTVDDPSDDSYSGDLVVRTNDSFQVVAGWTWNGEAGGSKERVVIKGTLPSTGTLPDGSTGTTKSYTWDRLPSSCLADESSISADKQTMTCVRFAFDKNDVGTYSEDLPFNVIVKGETLSKTKPGDITFEISAEDATTKSDDTDGYSLTVTAAPRWNLQKSMYTAITGYEHNGVKGWLMDYKFYIEVDEVNGEIDNASALVGNESMGRDATFTFKDDMSNLAPHAELVGCSFKGRFVQQDGYVGSADPLTYSGEGSIWGDSYPERKIAQTADEREIICTQSGSTIDVTAKHIDATLTNYPKLDYRGYKLPVNRGIAVIGSIYVFVPLDDVKPEDQGGDNPNSEGWLKTKNTLTNFDPVTPTGNENFGGERESEKDNSYSYTLYYSRGSFSKYYRGESSSVWTYPGGAATYRSGDGMATQGYEFSTVLVSNNTGGTNFTQEKMCDVVDAYRLDIQDIGNNQYYNIIKSYYGDAYHFDNQPVMYRIWNGSGLYDNNKVEAEEPYVFEYASTYEDDSWLPSRGGDQSVAHTAEVIAECSADDTKWFATSKEARDDANGIGTVTKVRVRLRDGVEHIPGSYVYIWLNHKIRSHDLKTGLPLENGDEITNFAANAFNDNAWSGPSYITENFPEPPSGYNGDRIIYTGPKARVIKNVDKVALSAGDSATFNLQISFTNDTGIEEYGYVKVTDLLPKGLKYVAKSVTEPYSEPVIGSCEDVLDLNSSDTPCNDIENQVLIWDLGTRRAGEVFPDINYSTVVGVEVNDGTIRNVVKIEADTDASPISQRKSDVGMSVTIPASINIVKSTEENPEYPSLRERTTEAKDINFVMDMRNGKAGDITDLDVIDILPFKGDGNDGAIKFNTLELKRKVDTSFHGSSIFNKAELVEHPLSSTRCDLDANGGVKYYYTKADPTTINIAPTVGDANIIGGESTIWCEGDENGPNGCNGLSNADVTAVRARGPRMEESAICQFKVSLSVKDNLAGDNYSNSAGASATGITLPVLSNSLAVPVVGSSLGDKVWYDSNINGIQDDDEVGVARITVHLLDKNGEPVPNPVNPNEDYIVKTDAEGKYLFEKLNLGNYYVQFDLPEKFVGTEKGVGSNSSVDSNIGSNGKTSLISLDVEEHDLSVDAGIYKLVTLGDTVWYDNNQDGIQDSTEGGVNGVKVTLYNEAGNIVATTVTDEKGVYLFKDVIPGNYRVGFTDLPSAFGITKKDATNDRTDSDVDPTTGKTDLIIVNTQDDMLDIDMGIYKNNLAILGDTVWYDDNRNGLQDLEEKGVKGVKVTLFDSNGNIVQTTVTDDKGTYLFRDVVPAEYTVGFTDLPPSYLISPKDKGIDDSKDSDTDEITGKTDSITLVVGENNLDADMGIYTKRFVTVGDAVWYDDNRNGVQDNDEKGVKAVKVTLFDLAGEVVAVTTTDKNGIYQFRDILPGVYSLGFTDLPVDYLISPKSADSVVNPQTGKTVTFELVEGDIDLSFDMGIYTNTLGTIGDSVWYDDNLDGIQDATERGVEAVKVTLYDANNMVVATTTTDKNGNYQFRDLSLGTYIVGFTDLPVGYQISPKDIGDDDKDSDVNVATNRSEPILLSEGSHDLTVDMGIYRENRAIIGNSVWYDDNRDGIQDATEKGAEAVKIELFSSDGTLVASTTTDEDGHYQFRNLVSGSYYVQVSDLPVGYEITKENAGSNEIDSDVDAFGKTANIDLKEGDVVTTVDMGIFNRQRATIGSHVWYDENRNGLQDSVEKGVEAVKVTLYDESNHLVSTTTTDRNGLYQFRDLLPGSYHVGFSELPVGYEITVKNAQNDTRDSEDSDADEAGNTVVTILEEGENDVTWDMGIYNSKRASIGDVVWYDDDKDGIQGSNEFGVDAVKVTLYRGDNTLVGTTVTDTKGNYKFGNLIPDDYYVIFSDLPVGYRATVANNGSDFKDSDADVTTLRTETTRLEAGENDLSWDMGIHNELRASIGNTVWYDDNKNGIQDSYEFGVSAVKAILYTQAGTKVAETLTDERGNYAFRNLLPNTYYLEFSELPSSYEVSPKNSADRAKDSDVNPSTLRTDMITVNAGDNDLSWDMGLFNKERASLGNKVWFDDNHDGLQDITEKGVSAVKITLFDKDNNIVKTTRTNQYGEYIFRDLVPGEYYVGFSEFPATYMITKQNVKDDWKEDSDANYHRGQTIHTTLEAGENDLSWDVGLYVPTLVNIGNKVWYDENVNGIQDEGEKGVKNVRVTLIKNGIPQIPSEQTTTPTTSVLTDENGEYLFENIEAFAPHEYHVVFDQETLPEDFLITRQNIGEDNSLDSDANPETGETKDVILTSEDDLTWDMGIQTLHVYDDTVIANTEGPVTVINVLENDNGDINNQTIKFINTNRGEVLWNNGTAVAGANISLSNTLVVPNEGVWSVQDGKIVFTAEDGFEGIPTPIYYVVEGDSGRHSNVGQVKFKTPCTCETYTTGENSVPSLNYWSIMIILFSISILGTLFARREFEELN
jgi:uncharacterized repeat protein (TIGR01451 family)